MKRVARVMIENLVKFFERAAHQRLARNLLTLTDKQLEDIGFSRQELQKGADGYPWREENSSMTEKGRIASNRVESTKAAQAATITSDNIVKVA